MMESIIQLAGHNRIILLIGIILLSVLMYIILKRVLKIFIILIIAILLYAGYMKHINGESTQQFFVKLKNTLYELHNKLTDERKVQEIMGPVKNLK